MAQPKDYTALLVAILATLQDILVIEKAILVKLGGQNPGMKSA